MPKKPIEMERLILADGWIFKSQTGSHRHYIHPTKPEAPVCLRSTLFRRTGQMQYGERTPGLVPFGTAGHPESGLFVKPQCQRILFVHIRIFHSANSISSLFPVVPMNPSGTPSAFRTTNRHSTQAIPSRTAGRKETISSSAKNKWVARTQDR